MQHMAGPHATRRWTHESLTFVRRSLMHGLMIGVLLTASGCGDDDPTLPASAANGRGANVAHGTLTGPVSGGSGSPFIASTSFDLARVGYEQAEYFLSGSASSYAATTGLAADGLWGAAAAARADYKTRVLVYRPIDAAKFNGTVFVEWLNVSGGLDAAADWLMGHVQLIREGAAWVGVSAQYVGVEGGAPLFDISPTPLKTVDAVRYGSLVHPGDSFSYDIFSQTAQALRRPGAVNPLPGFSVAKIIAMGESQSAFRLVTYINAVHPLAAIYDGFLVHSRGGSGVSAAPLSQAPQPLIEVPAEAQIRADVDVPVLTFQTESDLTILGFAAARQPDSDHFRLWEVAGTSHADAYTIAIGATDIGDSPDAARLFLTNSPAPGITCTTPINSGPQHFVLKAAIAALGEWVRHGTLPPSAPRLEVNLGPPAILLRDVHGNARGGIRTPQVDVPIATFVGEGRGSIICLLFGRTLVFNAAKLAMLYPTHDAYVSAFNAATDQAVQARFILPADAALMKSAAASSDIGR